jgi:hypothetical protein
VWRSEWIVLPSRLTPITTYTPEDYIHAVLDIYLLCLTLRPVSPSWITNRLKSGNNSRSPCRELTLLLAAYRSASRSPQARPLPPIRSHRYFRPVLEELQANPPHPKSPPAYLRYKAEKLLNLRLLPSP